MKFCDEAQKCPSETSHDTKSALIIKIMRPHPQQQSAGAFFSTNFPMSFNKIDCLPGKYTQSCIHSVESLTRQVEGGAWFQPWVNRSVRLNPRGLNKAIMWANFVTPKTIYCSGSTKVDIDEYQDIGDGSWKKNRSRSCYLLRICSVKDFIDYTHIY